MADAFCWIIGIREYAMQASDLTLTTSFESTGPGGHVTQSSTTLMIHGQRSRTPEQSHVGDAPRGYARISELKTGTDVSWMYRAEMSWAKFWNGLGL